MTTEEEQAQTKLAKMYYDLGRRDANAVLLANNFKTHKLPELAEHYLKAYGEKHFSHDWHTSG